MEEPVAQTLTFLFTDIEGSTRKWEAAPEAMRRAVALHDAVVRGVLERNGGHIFKALGDAFCAAFVGREAEVGALKDRVGASRLVTLTGPGGIGKTRLALQAAAEMAEAVRDGVWIAELATVGSGEEVAERVASVFGIREEPGRALRETLVAHLRNREALLILDNCEHVVSACAALAAEVLRGCPGVRLLATSQVALGVPGESVVPVRPLGLPGDWREVRDSGDPVGEAMAHDAVRLFVDRASLARPGFALGSKQAAAAARICWRLDGIPLAIELAAARVKVLSLEQIAERLDDRFRLLACGSRTALPRQQTLRALVDWSFDLLSEKERALVARLSVFGRGRSLEAVEEVCAGDGIAAEEILDVLSELVEKSFVWVEDDDWGVPRYFVSETVWDYGREKLEGAGLRARYRERHLRYFEAWAREREVRLKGAEQAEWFARYGAETGNFRLALGYAVEAGGEAARVGLALAASLNRYWQVRGPFSEGIGFLTKLLAASPGADDRLRGRASAALGRIAWAKDEYARAEEAYGEAVVLLGRAGEEVQRVLAEAERGFVLRALGRVEEAEGCFEEAVRRGEEVRDPRAVASGWAGLGSVALDRGEVEAALRLKRRAMEGMRALGDTWVLSLSAWSLGMVSVQAGDWEGARAAFRESAGHCRALGNAWMAGYVLEGLAWVALGMGDAGKAAFLLGAAEAQMDKHGMVRTEREAALRAELERGIAGACAEADARMAEGRKMRGWEALDQAP